MLGAGPAEIVDHVAFNELEMEEDPATGEASTCGALSRRDSAAVVVNGNVFAANLSLHSKYCTYDHDQRFVR